MSGVGGRGSNRRDQPGGWGESAALWALIAVILSSLGIVYAAVHLGHRLAGSPAAEQPPSDPFETFFGVVDRTVTWPVQATYVAVGIGLVLVAIAVAGVRVVTRRRRQRSRLDWTATYLGRGREIEGISQAESRRKADSWGLAADAAAGVCLGRALLSGQRLYASYEDVMVLVAGPRTGKTLCYAIPALLDAPGAVLVTSNKRDLVDATRDVRAAIAGDTGEVWVFDPQSIANEPPDWWWNPLTYVTDEVKAANLADHFATGSRAADAKTDAYFEPAARDQLAGLLLAAALDERPITDVYRWITRPTDEAAVEILERHGYPLTADQLAGVIAAPDKQRAGVYGAAQQMASCLTNRAVLRWITDDGTTGRRHFDPAEFVRSTGALYSLSKEGRGTAGPLVTALTVAVVEAAEQLATIQAYGRLRTPLVAVLDEAANVCRWRDLPDLYSHYGSRGIVILTILQSWSQGEEVWGRLGMAKLWSAANVAIYAGGVKEDQFLERLTKLIGQYDKITRSKSTRSGAGGGVLGTSGAQVSQQLSKERILEVDDLAALPRGRAIVLSSGNRATMVETLPWTTGAHQAAVLASIKTHDPAPQATLAQVAAGTQEVARADLAATKAPRR